MVLFENVQSLCKANKITLHSLEQELGLANGSLARWRRVDPAVSKVKLVADRFGTTVDYLLREHKSEEN